MGSVANWTWFVTTPHCSTGHAYKQSNQHKTLQCLEWTARQWLCGKTVFQAADNLRRLHAARLSRTCGYSLRCMLGTCGVNPIVFEFTCGLQRFGKVRCSAAKGLRLVSTRGVVGGAHLVTTHHCSACQACTASHNTPGGMQDLAVARVVL